MVEIGSGHTFEAEGMRVQSFVIPMSAFCWPHDPPVSEDDDMQWDYIAELGTGEITHE